MKQNEIRTTMKKLQTKIEAKKQELRNQVNSKANKGLSTSSLRLRMQILDEVNQYVHNEIRRTYIGANA